MSKPVKNKALLAEVTFECNVTGHVIKVRTCVDMDGNHITTTEHDIKGDAPHTAAFELYNHMMQSLKNSSTTEKQKEIQ